MKKIITVIVLLVLTIVNLYSADKQFYFVGKYGRLGSLSQEANAQSGVYLRWDLIEGEFPQEINEIKLIRIGEHNQTLLDVNSSDMMTASQISQMFQSVGSQRRLFEIINSISKSDNPQCTNANIGNIGDKILSCLQDNYWSFLASRVNFDIARARFRAYLDTTYDKTKSSISYLLLGFNGTQKIVLGKTQVYLDSNHLLDAKDFKQIVESKCNDNRYALDDYRVGLSWKNGGDNATEFFANGLMISGYDLYYSTKPVSKLPHDFAKGIDMAKIASMSTHNSEGEINPTALKRELNLAKANETLITLGEKMTDGKKPIYIESMKTLKERGFKPGERRYYFLVARDFTGNYGRTIYIKVVIPDLLKPAKPINPRAIEDSNKTTLIWDAVTPSNYLDYYRDMKACSHRIGNRVTFVESNQSCQKGEGVTLNFNVDKYYVYRFDNNQEAASFEDKNLNGISDVREELNVTTCQVKRHLSSKYNRLVKKISNSNFKIIKFHDENVNKSQEYWYRIVSVTKRGVTSQPTMPIRAFVPERKLLDAPELNVTEKRFTIGEKDNNDDNEQNFFIENNTDIFVRARMEYDGGKIFNFDVASGMFLLPDALKDRIFTNPGGVLSIKFFNEQEKLLGIYYSKTAAMFRFREIRDEDDKSKIIGYKIISAIKRVEFFMKDVEIKNAEPIHSSCVSINLDKTKFMKNQNFCTEVSLAMGNSRYKLSQYCDNRKKLDICAKKSSYDLYSVGVSLHYDNGQMSYPAYFSFIPNRYNLSIPNKPALEGELGVDIASKRFHVSIKPQIEKVTGTMLYLYNKNKSISRIKMVSHLDNHKPKDLIPVELNVSDISIPDTWCIKAKTIGLDGQVSEWSTPLCRDLVLSSKVEKEDLLAWPILSNNVVQGDSFNISFENNTTKIEILETFIGKRTCAFLRTFSNKLNFVVYRSMLLPNGKQTKFVQVSPFIMGDYCKDNEVFEEKDNLQIEYTHDKSKTKINFVDKYPYIVGEKYQYVLLFFNNEMEISSYSLTHPQIIQIH